MSGPSVKQLRAPTGTAGDVPVLQANKHFASASGGGVASAQVSADLVDAITAVTPATPALVDSFNALSHPDGSTTGQRFSISVPQNYLSGDLNLKITYSMSTAVGASAVRVESQVDLIDVSAGTASTLIAATPATHNVPATTNIVRESFVTVSEGTFAKGDRLQFFIKRLGADGADTHTGAWQVVSYEVDYTASGGSVAATASEQYLHGPNFKVITVSGVNGDLDDDLDLGTDFESWALMTSTVAAGRVDAQFSGRLAVNQTTITSIKIPLKGTGEYQIKVYVEGSGATNVYTSSALTAAPGSRTLITLTDADLSSQPSGERRYHVVVEATLDASEVLRVGRPYTAQE